MSFEARFYGRCVGCDRPIHPSDLVQYDEDDELVHEECVDRPLPQAEVACARCNLVHVGECW